MMLAPCPFCRKTEYLRLDESCPVDVEIICGNCDYSFRSLTSTGTKAAIVRKWNTLNRLWPDVPKRKPPNRCDYCGVNPPKVIVNDSQFVCWTCRGRMIDEYRKYHPGPQLCPYKFEVLGDAD